MSTGKDIAESIVKSVANRYHRVCAASDIHWQTEKMHVLSIVKSTPKLRACTQDSLGDAVLQAGSMGLSLNPQKQHCYLIPRRARKQKQGESDNEYAKVPSFAYASPSYKGLSHLSVVGGSVLYIRAQIVFKDDFYESLGPVDKPIYKELSIKTNNRKEPHAIGVFAIAETKGGAFLHEFVDRDTVQRIRNMSEQSNSNMWSPDKLWTEGWKKAAIRRLYKTLPDTHPALETAISLLDKYEGVKTEEKEVEAVRVLSDDQANKIHALLSDNGIEDAKFDKWLTRLAVKYGVSSYTDIPESHFNDAYQTIKDAVGEK